MPERDNMPGQRRVINVLALLKGEERYVFLFDDDSAEETMQMMGKYAADPEMSFTWYDAAMLSQKVRNLIAAACEKPEDQSSDLSGPEEIPGISEARDQFFHWLAAFQ